jgi:hypothetical protein
MAKLKSMNSAKDNNNSDQDARSRDSNSIDIDPFEHIKTLEEIESSFPSKSPRSERRKLSLRAKLKALTKESSTSVGGNDEPSLTSLSLKSSDGEMPPPPPPEVFFDEEDITPRVRRSGGKKKKKSKPKSGGRSSFDTMDGDEIEEDADEVPLTYDEMVQRHKKVERRGSLSSSKRIKKKKEKDKDKKRRHSEGSLRASKDKARAARAARANARTHKEEGSCEEDDHSDAHEDDDEEDARSLDVSYDHLVGSSKQQQQRPEKGYESDGVLGGAKLRARAGIARRRGQKGMPRHSPTSPYEERRQAIMADLDAFDNRESVTTMYLKEQIESLKKQVETLTTDKESVQEKLGQELLQNEELRFKLSEQDVGSGGGSTVQKLRVVHKEEKLTWEKQLKEKDVCIDKLQVSINEILVSKGKETSPLMDGEREHLTRTNAKVSLLEETIEIQKSQIDDLTLKLSEISKTGAAESKLVNQLQEELKQAKCDKVALNRDLEKVKQEYEASMARKDETVTFFQKELTKLKQTESNDGEDTASPLSAAPGRRSMDGPGSGRLSLRKLVSPFGRKGSVVPPPPESALSPR